MQNRWRYLSPAGSRNIPVITPLVHQFNGMDIFPKVIDRNPGPGLDGCSSGLKDRFPGKRIYGPANQSEPVKNNMAADQDKPSVAILLSYLGGLLILIWGVSAISVGSLFMPPINIPGLNLAGMIMAIGVWGIICGIIIIAGA